MPIQYIPYYPEPIQGQAILNNFTRTQRALKYRDNDKVFTRILRGLPLYEVESVETVGKNPNGNLVMRGECVSACAYLKQQNIKVDLVYIDPPFASGADYAKKIYLRRNPKVAKAIEQAEQEMDDEALRGFEEKMYGDIWNKEAYLNWMYENLYAIKSVMSANANIFVHLDWNIGHYVKVMMDEIFGEDNFLNEIVWYYYNKLHDSRKKILPRAHDVIFRYVLNEDSYTHNPLKEDRDAPVKKLKYKKVNGQIQNIIGEDGKAVTYISEEKTIDDVWRIRCLQPANQQEWLDYDTQKPEDLIQRILYLSTNKDMVVADFFGGSGVTAKAAHDLGRTFIHVDVGLNSIQTARDRLKAAKASFEVLEVNDGVSLFRNPAQTMDKLKSLVPGLGVIASRVAAKQSPRGKEEIASASPRNDGLSDFWAGGIHDSKKGLMPVFLPNLLDHTQKILDKPLLNRILNEALPDLPDEVQQVIVYFVDLEDRRELEKFIEEYNPLPQIRVELRDLKDVLHEIVTNDEVEFKVGKSKEGTTIEFTRFYSDRLMQKIEAYNQKRGLNGNGKKRQIELDEANGDEDEIASASPRNDTAFKPLEVSENGLELIELVSLDCTSAKGKWNSDVEIKMDKKGFVIRDGEKTKEFWDGTITSKQKPLRLKVRNIAGDETVVELKR